MQDVRSVNRTLAASVNTLRMTREMDFPTSSGLYTPQPKNKQEEWLEGVTLSRSSLLGSAKKRSTSASPFVARTTSSSPLQRLPSTVERHAYHTGEDGVLAVTQIPHPSFYGTLQKAPEKQKKRAPLEQPQRASSSSCQRVRLCGLPRHLGNVHGSRAFVDRVERSIEQARRMVAEEQLAALEEKEARWDSIRTEQQTLKMATLMRLQRKALDESAEEDHRMATIAQHDAERDGITRQARSVRSRVEAEERSARFKMQRDAFYEEHAIIFSAAFTKLVFLEDTCRRSTLEQQMLFTETHRRRFLTRLETLTVQNMSMEEKAIRQEVMKALYARQDFYARQAGQLADFQHKEARGRMRLEDEEGYSWFAIEDAKRMLFEKVARGKRQKEEEHERLIRQFLDAQQMDRENVFDGERDMRINIKSEENRAFSSLRLDFLRDEQLVIELEDAKKQEQRRKRDEAFQAEREPVILAEAQTRSNIISDSDEQIRTMEAVFSQELEEILNPILLEVGGEHPPVYALQSPSVTVLPNAMISVKKCNAYSDSVVVKGSVIVCAGPGDHVDGDLLDVQCPEFHSVKSKAVAGSKTTLTGYPPYRLVDCVVYDAETQPVGTVSRTMQTDGRSVVEVRAAGAGNSEQVLSELCTLMKLISFRSDSQRVVARRLSVTVRLHLTIPANTNTMRPMEDRECATGVSRTNSPMLPSTSKHGTGFTPNNAASITPTNAALASGLHRRISMDRQPGTSEFHCSRKFSVTVSPPMLTPAPDKLIVPFDLRRKVSELSKVFVWLLSGASIDHANDRNFAGGSLKVRVAEGYDRDDNIAFNCTDNLNIRKTEILYYEEVWGEIVLGRVQTSSANTSSREVQFQFDPTRNITSAWMERFMLKFQFSTASLAGHRRIVEFTLVEGPHPHRQSNTTITRIEVSMHGTSDDYVKVSLPEDGCVSLLRASCSTIPSAMLPHLTRRNVKLFPTFGVDPIASTRQDTFIGGHLKVSVVGIGGLALGEVVVVPEPGSSLTCDDHVLYIKQTQDKFSTFAQIREFRQGGRFSVQFDFVEARFLNVSELVRSLAFRNQYGVSFAFPSTVLLELYIPDQAAQMFASREKEPHALRFSCGTVTLPSPIVFNATSSRASHVSPADLSTPVRLQCFTMNEDEDSSFFVYDGATVVVELLHGDEGDEIMLLDGADEQCPMPYTQKYDPDHQLMHIALASNKTVATYPRPGANSPLTITFTGRKRGEGRVQMHRIASDHRYTARQSLLQAIVDNLALRLGTAPNPLTRKLIRITVEDTFGAHSQAISEVVIHEPNSQTEIVLPSKHFIYRRGNTNVAEGWMFLMPLVELVDEDTEFTGEDGIARIDGVGSTTLHDVVALHSTSAIQIDPVTKSIFNASTGDTLGHFATQESVISQMDTLEITFSPGISLMHCQEVLRTVVYKHDDMITPGMAQRDIRVAFNAGDGVDDTEVILGLSVQEDLLSISALQELVEYEYVPPPKPATPPTPPPETEVPGWEKDLLRRGSSPVTPLMRKMRLPSEEYLSLSVSTLSGGLDEEAPEVELPRYYVSPVSTISVGVSPSLCVDGSRLDIELSDAEPSDEIVLDLATYIEVLYSDTMLLDVRIARDVTGTISFPTKGYSGVVIGTFATSRTKIEISFNTTLTSAIIPRMLQMVRFYSPSSIPHMAKVTVTLHITKPFVETARQSVSVNVLGLQEQTLVEFPNPGPHLHIAGSELQAFARGTKLHNHASTVFCAPDTYLKVHVLAPAEHETVDLVCGSIISVVEETVQLPPTPSVVPLPALLTTSTPKHVGKGGVKQQPAPDTTSSFLLGSSLRPSSAFEHPSGGSGDAETPTARTPTGNRHRSNTSTPSRRRSSSKSSHGDGAHGRMVHFLGDDIATDAPPHPLHQGHGAVRVDVTVDGTDHRDSILSIPSSVPLSPMTPKAVHKVMYKNKDCIGVVNKAKSTRTCLHIDLEKCKLKQLADLIGHVGYCSDSTSEVRRSRCLEIQVKFDASLPPTYARRNVLVIPRRLEAFRPTQPLPVTVKYVEVLSANTILRVEPGDEICVELIEGTAVPPHVTTAGRVLEKTDRLFIYTANVPELYVVRKAEVLEKASGMKLSAVSYHPDASSARRITFSIPCMGKSLTGTSFVDVIKSVVFENKEEAVQSQAEVSGRGRLGMKRSFIGRQSSRGSSMGLPSVSAAPRRGAQSKKDAVVVRTYPVARVTCTTVEGDMKAHTVHYVLFDEHA
eukprot:PhM_4_TR15930/c0_g1_i1/m.948